MNPLLGALVFIALVLAVAALVRWPPLGLIGIGAFAVCEFDVPVMPPLISMAGVQLTAVDAFVLALAAAVPLGGIRAAAERQKPHRVAIILMILLILVATQSLVRGVSEFGASPAFNEFRAWFYVTVSICWVVVNFSRGGLNHRSVQNWAVLTGVCILAVSAFHVALYGLGNASSSVRAITGEVVEAGRPMTSGQAMVLVMAAIFCCTRYLHGDGRRHGALGLLFATAILIGQHRSVWIAALLAVFTVVVFRPGRMASVGLTLVPALLLLLAGATAFGALDALFASLQTSATDTRTYDGRVFDWLTLVNRNLDGGLATVLFGEPYGAGWDRLREDGLLIRYPPHNWFVSTALRLGAIGLVLLVSLLALVIVASRRQRLEPPLMTVICALAAYAWAYNMNWYLAPVLAICLFAGETRTGRTVRSVPTTRREVAGS